MPPQQVQHTQKMCRYGALNVSILGETCTEPRHIYVQWIYMCLQKVQMYYGSSHVQSECIHTENVCI